jgi:hypothetical protein
MIIEHCKCQFCHKPLVLEIDDDYAATGDRFKLIPYAACNRCADLRTRRRILTEAIGHIMAIAIFDRRPAILDSFRTILGRLTSRYVEMVSDWTGNPEMEWDEGIVDALIRRPGEWGKTMQRLWPTKPKQESLL